MSEGQKFGSVATGAQLTPSNYRQAGFG